MRADWTQPYYNQRIDLSSNICYDIYNIKIKLDLTKYNDPFYSYKILSEFYNIDIKNIAIGLGLSELITRLFIFIKNQNMSLTIIGEPTWQLTTLLQAEYNIPQGNDFAYIGHHSHTHEYLIDVSNDDFILDIETANKIFLRELGYVPSLFSYPFGEYSKFMKDYISKNFKYAFGQHSGVIDLNKDKFELPRFPINEKYGELKRFKSIINYFPLEYKRILPEEKQLFENTNPPNFKVEFFKEQKNLSNINCYSNEGDVWEKSKTNFANNSLTIEFREPFKPRRGRINCSLNDNGKWRWFGVQFPIKEN